MYFSEWIIIKHTLNCSTIMVLRWSKFTMNTPYLGSPLDNVTRSLSIRPPFGCVVSSSLVDLGSLKICITLWLRSSLVLRERIVSTVRQRGERRHLRWTLHSHRQRIRCASWSWIGSLYSLFQRYYIQEHFFFPNKTYKGLCISWVVVLGNELVVFDP